MSDDDIITGTIFCPKCGYRFSVRKSRPVACQICKKDVLGEYPRIKLRIQIRNPDNYTNTEKPLGYICKICAVKLGISMVQAKTEATTEKSSS